MSRSESNSSLFRRVASKANGLVRMAATNPRVSQLLEDVRLLLGMVRDREFELSPSSKAAIVGALLYFLLPLDAVADFIPGLGLIDDATVIGLVMKQVHHELVRYRQHRHPDN